MGATVHSGSLLFRLGPPSRWRQSLSERVSPTSAIRPLLSLFCGVFGRGKLRKWLIVRDCIPPKPSVVPTLVLEPDGGSADTIGMFLRSKTRKKDGKEHGYWSVVENRRVADGRVVQRHVLYLGEINDAQRAAWCRSIEIFDEDRGASAQMALFLEDRPAPELACAVVQVKLSGLQLHRPRQWGACWLACGLWDLLQLDTFWQPRLPPSRKGTRWLNVLKTLVAYRLIDPGSEWR